ncbi:hypothetical protein WN48_03384 [Eufriesea mexicana]|uniref:Uncharacterized protein n=1 Tax=Eufriesea mexicana TaxID=516756 RepID=A0A310SAT5_9HYME|nr:hypothetical protein WN48_03384 [Eufriesea mexicana]
MERLRREPGTVVFVNRGDSLGIFLAREVQSATSPGASNDGLTKQQLELIQQIMQQTQQQQQQQQQQISAQQPQQQRNNSSTTVTAQIQKTQKPSVKSTTSSGSVSNNSGSSNATNNARSSPKPKVWSHVQSKKRARLGIDRIAINMYEIFADGTTGWMSGSPAPVRSRNEEIAGIVVTPGKRRDLVVIGQEFVDQRILRDFRPAFVRETGKQSTRPGSLRALFHSARSKGRPVGLLQRREEGIKIVTTNRCKVHAIPHPITKQELGIGEASCANNKMESGVPWGTKHRTVLARARAAETEESEIRGRIRITIESFGWWRRVGGGGFAADGVERNGRGNRSGFRCVAVVCTITLATFLLTVGPGRTGVTCTPLHERISPPPLSGRRPPVNREGPPASLAATSPLEKETGPPLDRMVTNPRPGLALTLGKSSSFDQWKPWTRVS